MRFYPSADINFYYEIPASWDLCNYRHAPVTTWKRGETWDKPTRTINYWCDLEGSRKKDIRKKDLYFENWPRTRLREGACLPLYYDGGQRYIRLQKAYPVGFKCRIRPLALREILELEEYERKRVKENTKKKRKQKEEPGKKVTNRQIIKRVKKTKA